MKESGVKAGRSGLLLTEILIALVFFAVIGAVCLQVFVKSHMLTRRTKAMNLAVTECQSVSTLLRQKDAAFPVVLECFYPEGLYTPAEADLYYAGSGETSAEAEAFYQLTIIREESSDSCQWYALSFAETDHPDQLLYETRILVSRPLTFTGEEDGV